MATTHHPIAHHLKEIPKATHFRFGIVVSDWNKEITENLHKGVLETLKKYNAKEIVSWYVPGSFELIYGAKKMVQTLKVDATIVIGCVVKGQTKHFDYVCEGLTQGIKDLNLQQNIPIIFCVLTDNSIEQSKERSGGALGNKGVECAIAAIQMANLKNF